MNQTFEIFYPNRYTPEERRALDGLMEEVRRSGGQPPNHDRTVHTSQQEMLEYAKTWDPYNPLYNDPAYAETTRWGRLPALPCYPFFENISGFPMMDSVGKDLGNVLYYANDGGEIELTRPVFAGEALTFRSTVQTITDDTEPTGSELRKFTLYGEAEMRDAQGNLVGHGVGRGRNAMKRVLSGHVPTEFEQTYEWIDHIPPVHVTTPQEWETIVSLWKGEEVRGSVPRYWEDVSVGDQVTPVCSGPVSDIEMIRMHYDMITHFPTVRDMVLGGQSGRLLTDAYGQKIPTMGRHFSYCRNPKARAVLFNFTARNFILRMLTNYIGDDGFLCAFKWRFQNLFACMSDNQPGRELLSKVPGMEGRYVNRHGMEGDTAICKGVITDKYEQEGKSLVTITCWAETFDGDIIQVVEGTAQLPRKKG